MKLTLFSFEITERCMLMDLPLLLTIRKPLFALHIFDCCKSSVKKYRLGTWKCHDDMNTSPANQIAAF